MQKKLPKVKLKGLGRLFFPCPILPNQSASICTFMLPSEVNQMNVS